MRCPFCQADDTRVIETRANDEQGTIRRRRECQECRRRFTTYERHEEPPLYVSKKDGRRGANQAFFRWTVSRKHRALCSMYISRTAPDIPFHIQGKVTNRGMPLLGEIPLEERRSVTQRIRSVTSTRVISGVAAGKISACGENQWCGAFRILTALYLWYPMAFTRFAPKVARHALRWDFRAGIFFGLYAGMTASFVGVIARDDLHASKFAISLLFAAPFLGNLLSMFVACHMQARAKMPYVVWLGSIQRGLLFLIPLATTAPVFIGIMVLASIIGCFSGPAYASIMKVAYPDAFRGRLMSFVRMGITVMMMAAAFVTGRLMQEGLSLPWVLAVGAGAAVLIVYELQQPLILRAMAGAVVLLTAYVCAPFFEQKIGYHVIFPLAGAFGILSSWCFSHLPDAKVEECTVKRFNVLEGLATLITDRRFGLYSLAFLVFGFGNLLQNPLVPLFQVDELHITKVWVGLLAMTTAGVSTLAIFFWGRMLDRYSTFVTVVISFAIFGFSPLVYANAHNVPTLMIAAVLVGIAGPAVELTALNAVLDFTDHEGIPRYMALHSFLIGIRGLLAPFVGTWLLDVMTIRQCFYVSAGIIWAGFLFMFIVVRYVLLPYQQQKRHTASRVPA